MTSRRTTPRAAVSVAGLVVAAIVLGVVVLWFLPSVLTRHPSAGLTAAERLRAVNDVRAPLVAFLVAVGAAGTLWFTARTYILNREGHVTDRYTKAVGQLGDPNSSVRVGSVYALERIAQDSPKDQVAIVYVLGAFVRERSKELRRRQDEPPEDVQTALRVLSRLLAISGATLDLRGADLRNTDLSSMRSAQILLDGADLSDARLPR